MEMKYLKLEEKQFAYYTAGQKEKPPIVLLHGWPETSRIWKKIIPGLAADYFILAIDLPGIAESDPVEKYDTASVAEWIRKITTALGISRFNLVSHDLGSWVASTYALKYPEEVESLVLIDAGVPGILPDSFFSFNNHQKAWHFYFHAVADLPEFLIRGREKEYFTWFFTQKSHIKTAISESDIDRYVQLYKDKLSSGFEYYRSYSESAQINKNLLRKLPIPVLTIGGGFAVGEKMKDVAIALSENWRFENIENCGHYVPEEQPEVLSAILQSFLEAK